VSHFLARCLIVLCFRLYRHYVKVSILPHLLPFVHFIFPFSPFLPWPLRIIAKLYSALMCNSPQWHLRAASTRISRVSQFSREKTKKEIYETERSCTTTILFFSTSLARISSFSFRLAFSFCFSLSLSRLLYYEINPRIRLSQCCNSLPLSPTSINFFLFPFTERKINSAKIILKIDENEKIVKDRIR